MRSRNRRNARAAREIVAPLMTRRVNALCPRRTDARSLSRISMSLGEVARAMTRRIALEPASMAANRTGAATRLSPEMRQSVRRPVVRAPDAKMQVDALSQHPVHLRDAAFAVCFDEA